MNKSMKWILESMERHLTECGQKMPKIYEDTKGDEIVFEINDNELNWFVIQYLIRVQIKHIWIWSELQKNATQATSYIRFDIKRDDCDSQEKHIFRIF